MENVHHGLQDSCFRYWNLQDGKNSDGYMIDRGIDACTLFIQEWDLQQGL